MFTTGDLGASKLPVEFFLVELWRGSADRRASHEVTPARYAIYLFFGKKKYPDALYLTPVVKLLWA